jgi:GTPase SAR1 family protein
MQLLEAVERQARVGDQASIHRKALELLHTLPQRAPSEGQETASLSLKNSFEGEGMLGGYAVQRAKLLESGNALLAALEQPNILRRLEVGDTQKSLLVRVKHRLNHVDKNRFRIAIVGEFSSGKSTFLNAMLGEAVLPSSVRPTTAAPNRLLWGEKPALRVAFLDGRTADAELEELASYTTERSNPANKRGVDHVEIAYPLELLRNGVELLDTPGISSLVSAHTKTTYELLPTCDAVVLLATGRQPFSDSIGRFLEDLRAAVEGKVFYVLNKIDQVEPEKRSQSIEFATRWVADKVHGARVVPVAAYHALIGRRLLAGTLTPDELEDDPRVGDERDPRRLLADSGMPELEHSIGQFLMECRGAPLLRSVASELLSLLRGAENALSVEREAGRMSAAERRGHYKQLAKNLAERRKDIDQMFAMLRQRFERLVTETEGRARGELPALADVILEKAGITASDAENEEKVKALSTRVGDAARRCVQTWMTDALKQSSGELMKSVDAARRELSAHRRDLSVSFASVFQTPIDPWNWDDSLSVTVDAGGDWVTAMSIPAAIGFISGLLLGPLAVLVAGPIGGLIASAILGDEATRQEKLFAQVKPMLEARLMELSEQVGGAVAMQLRKVTSQCLEGLGAAREDMMVEFDRELDALVAAGEQEGAVARNVEKTLKGLQAQASVARVVLEQIAQGEAV